MEERETENTSSIFVGRVRRGEETDQEALSHARGDSERDLMIVEEL